MDIYTHDLSLFDFNLSDAISKSLSQRHDSQQPLPSPTTSTSSNSAAASVSEATPKERSISPAHHRHDGKSPLPLGMDWSPPPRKWDGRDTVWPHDPQTGWSYCATIPSWIFLPLSSGSEPVVFFRVQVGIQSPESVTAIHGLLRRFSDFLNFYKELKREFPTKRLPPAPPKKILRIKSRTVLEERRCALEDWMEKLLSDIELSRTAAVANFLELEAAVVSGFSNVDGQDFDWNSTANDAVDAAATPSAMSDHGNDSAYEISEQGTPRLAGDSSVDLTSEYDFTNRKDNAPKYGIFSKSFILDNLERISRTKLRLGDGSINERRKRISYQIAGAKHQDEEAESLKLHGHARQLSSESLGSDISSTRNSEASNLALPNLFGDISIALPEDAEAVANRDFSVAFLLEERQKLNRVLSTVRQRVSTARTDMEDLIGRLNQETAVRQFLATKVKDLEVELETTRLNCTENVQQAALIEKEKFTQMQWDMEELRRKCLELELKLKAEQDEKALLQSEKMSVIEEREVVLRQLDVMKEQIEDLHKHHEEFEAKSKADVKLLVKEVKSLRNSQSELKLEFGLLMKEKVEVEKMLQKEKHRMEQTDATNMKLLHECEILRTRLQECSVNFLSEEEDKLILDTSSPSDAIDLLTTSDNRIGLLLAEAQLLAQDVENALMLSDEGTRSGGRKSDDELRKMLTDVFIDNAALRKQVNAVIRYTLNTYSQSEKGEDEEEEVQVPVRRTVLSKFL